MVVPFALAIIKHRSRVASFFGVTLIGSFLLSRLMIWFWRYLIENNGLIREDVAGLYEITAVVSILSSRLFAPIVVCLFAIPAVIGLLYAIRESLSDESFLADHSNAVRFSLIIFVGSWLAWYVILSSSTIRYLFPAVFVSSIFVAWILSKLTSDFNLFSTIRNIVGVLHYGFTPGAMRALLGVFLIGISVPRAVIALYNVYALDRDSSVHEAARFLNTQTPAGSLVETYDSQLFFLLKRPYHYPPDQVHIKLIRQTRLFGDETAIDYDALTANPDYIVVGPHSKFWRLYEAALKNESFRLVGKFTQYEIFARVRTEDAEFKRP